MTKVLFACWPDTRALAKDDVAQFTKVIEPLGLAQQKAPRLIAIASSISEVPRSIEQLVALPGVGRKTANVVLTQTFGIASGVIVDLHMARVAKRLGLTQGRRAGSDRARPHAAPAAWPLSWSLPGPPGARLWSRLARTRRGGMVFVRPYAAPLPDW